MPFRHIPIKIVFFFQLKIFSVEKKKGRWMAFFKNTFLKEKTEKKKAPGSGGYGQKAREWGGLRCGWSAGG
ncbi:hypothetical protein ACFOUP_12360 [Belliella kenyensis]|uniref:Uncharacterized protein n=1 Tax=Belliella kenyensis TaxID=1472724 RepID=A0ABV8ELJ7_9BACT|nr:hypothetical protein [Belliella kenyensis]MCH7400757.1 hypothetical protein [Belliella kenyensis]MCH7400766.1 hypothetical protein [Belliella kenyensis]MDN3601946.1 hypothetical protein [Belliella kenyensis]MDN3601955.1 hypothetical protein [Belliella kenyensis]